MLNSTQVEVEVEVGVELGKSQALVISPAPTGNPAPPEDIIQ